MTDLDAFYRIYLKQEFAKRKAKNSRYSLRAFARSLGWDIGFVSRLLAGKCLLSLDLADTVARKLRLDETTRKEFLLSAIEEQKCHALYLIDPDLTDCEEEKRETNLLPRKRGRK